MVNRKITLYRQAKSLARTSNIAPLIYRTSTVESLTNFINNITRPPLPFLDEIRNRLPRGILQLRFSSGQTVEELKQNILNILRDDNNYYFMILTEDGEPFNIRREVVINRNSRENPYYNLHTILERIINNHEEYYVSQGYLIIQIHKQINDNQPLLNQRDGEMNCACKIVLDELNKHPHARNERKKKNIMKINERYLETGIDEEGLQELADKALIHLVIKDKIGEIWKEFKPKAKGKYKKLLLLSHNNHISLHHYDEPEDSDDEEEEKEEEYKVVEVVNEVFRPNNIRDEGQDIIWFDKSEEVVEMANEYEREGKEGQPITSKGELVAYITPDVIWKTKFDEYEWYEHCFTSGSVGKEKFIEQMEEQKLNHYRKGINETDPFHALLMDANRSGFYSRTAESSKDHTKYDQNKAYKSFNKSGLFTGFPILEAMFKIDKPFSELTDYNKGLLYVEWEQLTVDKLKEKIYYEGNGWYPVEIVEKYYNTYGINPFIKSYAYASETFAVDFENYTNEQFRSFMGKCVSKSFDEVWRTKDYIEYMRARYILRDRIIAFKYYDGYYTIIYVSDKKPWNMPVLAVYVHAHQKYVLFEQYNRLIDNDIPIAVNVDGIEVKKPCDHLFNMGEDMGQWEREEIKSRGTTPSVIERDKVEPRGEIQFSKDLILPKFLHISGAGGNGKSQYIIELAKIYPSLLFLAPTNDAVKNLIDRAKELNIQIKATTYHKAFGFGCEDRFPRHEYTRFVIDECSMISAENLEIIMAKLSKKQSLLLAGDFWQLPCIEETPIYDNWTHNKSREYEKFEIRELTKNWRQKEDREFFSLCNSLRGELSEEKARSILDMLNSRVVALPENNTLDDIHICGINTQIDSINNKYELEEGCKIICNMACNDKEGNYIPNGSIGIIDSMSPFKITWADGTKSTFKGVGKTKSKKPRFAPAYGLTIHKAQGKTLRRNVIINPSRLFAKNHLYVALTRATKFSSIYLTEKMSFGVFCKTVNVKGVSLVRDKLRKGREVAGRLERMVDTYIKEEPKLTVKFLEDMKHRQKNRCCYCSVSMAHTHGQPHSITLERVDDSKRHILSNIKLACSACNSAHRK